VSDDDAPFRLISIVDEPSVPVLGGSLEWIPLRRRLGIGAFGTNAYRGAHAGDVIIEEHVESPGQEEAYVVIRGRVRFTIDSEAVDAGPGAVVFVPDPGSRRSGVALEEESSVFAVGGWRDKPYHSLPWEPIYLAQEAMARGDWAEAAATLEREAGEHRETAIIRFRIACCLAQQGEHERALEELRAALETKPEMIEMAQSDELLAPLRELDGWPERG
jgi:hypothetical protein